MEVVVDARGHEVDEVAFTVSGPARPPHEHLLLLADERNEEAVRALADRIRSDRGDVAGTPDPTVVRSLHATAPLTPYRLTIPAGWRVHPDDVDALISEVRHRGLGLVSVLLAEDDVAQLEDTAIVANASRVRGEEDLLDVIDAQAGTWWLDGSERGFVHLGDTGSGGPARPGRPTPRPEAASAADETRQVARWRRLRVPGRRPGGA